MCVNVRESFFSKKKFTEALVNFFFEKKFTHIHAPVTKSVNFCVNFLLKKRKMFTRDEKREFFLREFLLQKQSNIIMLSSLLHYYIILATYFYMRCIVSFRIMYV